MKKTPTTTTATTTRKSLCVAGNNKSDHSDEIDDHDDSYNCPDTTIFISNNKSKDSLSSSTSACSILRSSEGGGLGHNNRSSIIAYSNPEKAKTSTKMGRNYFNSSKKSLYAVIFSKRRGSGASSIIRDGGTTIGIGEPSLYHALIIIFLEFFSWGLLTVPIINVISDTFPSNKFLMNGLILGVKGILSFLSAPMIGALSDIWGRKFFLLLTVFCTCMPIPWLRISPWWYFALFSISGVFSVTFSVVLAYVADITEKEDRSAAIGLVSATFGASLVTSPALGAWLSEAWSDDAVVALATAVAAADVFFIMAAVPESLPQKLRHSWSAMDWEKTDPFQVIGFSPEAVAAFIGLVGILSVLAQTGLLMALHRSCGAKTTITIGLVLQAIQLTWIMWAAGFLAAMSQITYPSVSAYVSVHTDRDKQGTVQGIITGVRGLCSGLGPALFGLIFYLFHVDLNIAEGDPDEIGALGAPMQNVVLNNRKNNKNSYKNYIGGQSRSNNNNFTTTMLPFPSKGGDGGHSDIYADISERLIPGPPFLVGAFLVLMALIVISYLPDNPTSKLFRSNRRSRSTSGGSSPLLDSGNESGSGGGTNHDNKVHKSVGGRTSASAKSVAVSGGGRLNSSSATTTMVDDVECSTTIINNNQNININNSERGAITPVKPSLFADKSPTMTSHPAYNYNSNKDIKSFQQGPSKEMMMTKDQHQQQKTIISNTADSTTAMIPSTKIIGCSSAGVAAAAATTAATARISISSRTHSSS